MTRQPPVQQIFNISNCNITMSTSADQQQQKRPGLDSYDPLAEINFDMDLFPDLLDIYTVCIYPLVYMDSLDNNC